MTRLLIILIVAIPILCLAFVLIDYCGGTVTHYAATVKALSYYPAERHFGSGLTSNGEMITSTSSSPAKYIVIVDVDGVTIPASATMAQWGRCKEGAAIDVSHRVGYFGGDWDWYAAEVKP